MKKKKKGWLKAVIITVLCLAAGGTGVYFYMQPEKVDVAVAQKTDISPVLSGIGKIEGSRKITVYAAVDSVISERYVIVGDRVKSGDALISYRDDTQQKQLEIAKTDVKFSKKTLEDIQAMRTEYQNTIDSANKKISDCEKRYASIESQILELSSSSYNNDYSQTTHKTSNENDINALQLQIQDKQTELSKAELEFKEMELITSEDTAALKWKLDSLLQKIKNYQNEIAALNEKIAALQSDSISLSVEGMSPEVHNRYLALQNDLEAVMRKWTDAKTQKETAQSLLAAYKEIGSYEQQVALDELSLNNAENELKKSNAGTTAPENGVITACLVDAGAYVDKGTPVIEMQSDDSYKVRLMVSKYDIAAVQVGQEADIKIGDNAYKGKVEKINQYAEDDASGKSKASVEICILSDSSFIVGLDADVTLHLESTNDVIAVPNDCVLTDDDGSYVYVVRDSVVEKLYIKTGKQDGSSIQVEGLVAGTHVICEPVKADLVGQTVVENLT